MTEKILAGVAILGVAALAAVFVRANLAAQRTRKSTGPLLGVVPPAEWDEEPW